MAKGVKRGGKARPQVRRKALAPKKTAARAEAGEASLKRQLAASRLRESESRAQQAATAEILKVIARSPSDVQPAFDCIVRNASKLCKVPMATVILLDGAMLHLASSSLDIKRMVRFNKLWPMPIERAGVQGIVARDRKLANVRDVESDKRVAKWARPLYRSLKIRSGLWVPMIRARKVIGLIAAFSPQPDGFGADSEKLLTSFADQAVIAIENARSFNATREALEQKSATAEILKVISNSPGDLKTVFDAILESSTRMCDAHLGILNLRVGERVRTVAHRGARPRFAKWIFARGDFQPDNTLGSMFATGRPVHVADLRETPGYRARKPNSVGIVELGGGRTYLAVPLLKDGKALGNITIYRPDVRPFTDQQVELVSVFASQAVIAIENARLFNETKEALERQTASAEVLRVISATTADTQPVFDAIVASAQRLMSAKSAILLLRRESEFYVAAYSAPGLDKLPPEVRAAPLDPDKNYPSRVILNREIVHLPDWQGQGVIAFERRVAKAYGIGSGLQVPLLRQGQGIGVLIATRAAKGAFSDKEIALLESFADQAVIAIENVRLFNETKEALERQTATAEILKVIASSPSDVQPVFDVIASASMRLIGGFSAGVFRFAGDLVHLAALTSTNPAGDEYLRKMFPRSFGREDQVENTVRVGRISVCVDIETDRSISEMQRELARSRGWRSRVMVPMVRENVAIGFISVTRSDAGAFSEHQIGQLKTFGDQAVIAIENVRLFNETKESLERQTATAEILKVIAGSPTDVQPAFDAIARHAFRLCEGMGAAVFRLQDGLMHFVAHHGFEPKAFEVLARQYPLAPRGLMGQALRERTVVHTPDMLSDPRTANKDLAKALQSRGFVAVPMLREGEPIGAIVVFRRQAAPFSDAHIAVMTTFADQAVIAIENVRLFNETKEALERQTATAGVLKAISRTTFDLQPVLRTLLENASRLCNALDGVMWQLDDAKNVLRAVAFCGFETGSQMPQLLQSDAFPVDRSTAAGRAILERHLIQIPELRNDPEYRKDTLGLTKANSVLAVPLLRDGKPIGAIAMAHSMEQGPFTASQIELVTTFADQAVIAIENVRLFNETKEALERQTATAEILSVIASSPSNVQPVFDAIAASAKRLLNGGAALVARRAGDQLELAAYTSTGEAADAELRKLFPSPITGQGHLGKAILSAAPVGVTDILTDESYSEAFRERVRARGVRGIVSVPMLRDGEAIGVISVNRPTPGKFSDHQTSLLRTFADQAVIAIENVRMFNETREALERQTATSEILSVMSRSQTDVQPVFDTIAARALRLCDGSFSVVSRFDGQQIDLAAFSNLLPEHEDTIRGLWPMQPGQGSGTSRAISEAQVVQIPDILEDSEYQLGPAGEAVKFRAVLAVPMIRDGAPIGVINVNRQQPGVFPEHQVTLLKTFADQAVIAVENVRLFNETREALERQTATAEILKVIASSPSDVQPVFDAIARSAKQLLGGHSSSVRRIVGDMLYMAALTSTDAVGDEALKSQAAVQLSRAGTINAQAVRTRKPAIRVDAETDPDVLPEIRELARARGFRSNLAVPMLRDGVPVGTINVTRREPGTFTAHQISLLQTFADQAVIAIENVRLFNETREALERQTATGEVLQVIARSTSDVAPVFEAILSSATRLCAAERGIVFRYDNGLFLGIAAQGLSEEARAEFLTRPMRPGPQSGLGRMLEAKAPVQVADVTDDDAYRQGDPMRLRTVRLLGARTAMWLPLLKDGTVIGAFAIYRQEVRPFSEQQIALVQTFASQAVIAIENVRLFNETKESLERQTATAEILKVIASSPTDVQPVFDVIVRNALRLMAGHGALVTLVNGDQLELAAYRSLDPSKDAAIRSAYPTPLAGPLTGLAVTSRTVQVVSDTENDPRIDKARLETARGRGYRSFIAMPLIREGVAIGTINVSRATAGPFSEHEIDLLKTFADQAVIAIENVRLFNETKEALERQTATADILRVISGSPTTTQPVFDAIVARAMRLCEAELGGLFLVVGDAITYAHTPLAPDAETHLKKNYPRPVDTTSLVGRSIVECQVVHVPDIVDPSAPGNLQAGHLRSQLTVPLRREGSAIGALVVARRTPGPFSTSQISLLQAFADQAVIAIENARLFNETKESLGRQTATAEILQVISSSPTDVQPVFDAIVRSALNLIGGQSALMNRVEGDTLILAALTSVDSASDGPTLRAYPRPLSGSYMTERVIRTRAPFAVEDAATDREVPPELREMARTRGWRSCLCVPMIREGETIGTIFVTRANSGKFSETEVGLLSTFADQAVIAIENVRLFKELQSRTEALTKSVGQLTALSEVGQAISSTLDLKKVLKTIVTRAVQLTGLDAGGIYEYDENTELFHLRAARNMSDEIVELLRANPIRRGEGAVGSTAQSREPVQVPDTSSEGYQSRLRSSLIRSGRRAVLAVPLLRDEHIIGALSVQRSTPGPFPDDVVELLKTFANQSAMAIQNARLFREIAEKGKQLEVASRHKSDFLANMSHELRTPLNAIIGFSEVLIERMFGELNEKQADYLKDIHESGRHLLSLINDILDLSKIEAGRMDLDIVSFDLPSSLANAMTLVRERAQRSGIALGLEVDPAIGEFRADERKVKQILLNLLSNAVKFTPEGGRVDVKAALQGGAVRIAVKDSGIGIAPEDHAAVFEEFKQVGSDYTRKAEGTGLGLALTRRFVELHGGEIRLESQPGKGSTFTFTLPVRT